VPGVGKTMLARSIAITTGCDFKRVQFTPDLLPSDVTGASVYNQQIGTFEYRPGPVMAQIVLADEINRATPKTQSALLEAMGEQQVTVEGVTHSLPSPFMVLATQNPIEYEGTFPLPEAQLDRFFMRISLGYPAPREEVAIMDGRESTDPIDLLTSSCTPDEIIALQQYSDSIYIEHNISVDNLEPVSTFLGMYGDPDRGGLDKATFLDRQRLYRDAEIASMLDMPAFIAKGWRLYGCESFVNDASGSLCEVVDPDNPEDRVLDRLTGHSLIVYIRADAAFEETLKARARAHPKPLFYNPDFLNPRLAGMPDDGAGIDPVAFVRPLFPDLLAFRRPRYERLARRGLTLEAATVFRDGRMPDADSFIATVWEHGGDRLAGYIELCERRRAERKSYG